MAAIQRAITSLLIITSVTSVFSGDLYGIINGSVELSAQVTKQTNVVAVTWKHNNNKAADWIAGDQEPTYYDIFEFVTTLDTQTWTLNISNLQPHFNGNYSAEVNNKDPTQFVTLTVIDAVSQPNITQVCNPSSCTLSCKAKEDEHSQYTWTDSRGERKDGPVWTRPEYQGVTYTCNVSNPVSWKIGTFPVPGRIRYDAVSQPNITQVCNSSSCTLTCKATEDEHSQYTWTDSRGEGKDGPVWTVENRAEDQSVTYTCNVSNPVSWKIETFPVPGRIAYEIILGIGSAVLVVLVLIGIGIGSYYCRKRKTGKLDLKTGQSSLETEERSIPMGNSEDAVEHIELSQTLLSQKNEPSVINNGTVAEVPNGTCSEATIQTDAKEEVPKLETSEVDVENGETPDDANVPCFDKNVI